jgi:hypothetical protein
MNQTAIGQAALESQFLLFPSDLLIYVVCFSSRPRCAPPHRQNGWLPSDMHNEIFFLVMMHCGCSQLANHFFNLST